MAKPRVENVDDLWGSLEGQCQGCDRFGPVNYLSLCQHCTAMLERDLIRERDWEYSVPAFGLSSEAREQLRRQMIAQFGEALELIAPANKDREKDSSRKRKKRRGRK